jgi:hypothetical protein
LRRAVGRDGALAPLACGDHHWLRPRRRVGLFRGNSLRANFLDRG